MNKLPRLSRWAIRFFRWFCRTDVAEDIEGDLLERYELRAGRHGQKKASRLLVKNVLQLFRPGIIRNFSGTQKLNSYDMFKNYLKTARRNLWRHKTYSFIKITGFALGISVCLLIALFIRDELSYDLHILDHENIYLAVKEYDEPTGVEKYTWMAPPFAKTMETDYPEVLLSGRFLDSEGFGAGKANIRLQNDPTNYYDEGFAFADQSFLDIFQFPLVYGSLEEGLKEKKSMVLTRSKANKLFPNVNPIGEIVYVDDNTEQPFVIRAVIEDLPENSTVQFSFLMSLKDRNFWPGHHTSWASNNYQTFVKLQAATDLPAFEERMNEMRTKYVLPTYVQNGMANAQELVDIIHFSLRPMADLHLYSADVTSAFQQSDIEYVMIFAIIATFILILACVNFINLSTAKSANRAKEVGLRKTIGSTRGHLISQFLSESILYSLLSFALAMGISMLLLPYFNVLAQKSIDIPWGTWWFIPLMVAASLLIGVFAGVYPAFYLSRFNPSAVLKGKLSLGSKSGKLRNGLVVFQFTASIILVIGTLVVYQQMQYILNRDLGFDKEQVLLIESPYLMGLDRMETFKSELVKLPGVESIAYSGYLPVSGSNRNGNMWWNDGRTKIDVSADGQNWLIDHDYLETFGISLIEGRNFSKEIKSDSAGVIINERMAKALGINEDPLGRIITNEPTNQQTYQVIGVIEDFHFSPLTQEIDPLVMRIGRNYSNASVKLSTAELSETIESIEEVWKGFAPAQPFIYSFLNQRFSQMYANVIRIQNILTAFSILAILIACLGLFGLSVFMVEQRNKEISVRLVLGAKTIQIIRLLGINFLKPILIAIVLATPIAWYLMRDWVAGFEYSKGLNVGVFVLASLSTLAIALITISFQSLKAALTSPVQGLRNE